MVKKLILLNLALLVMATWLVYRLDIRLKNEATRDNIAKIKVPPAGKKPPAPVTDPSKDKPAPSGAPAGPWEPEYKIVADKNLFSEDRSLAPKEPVAAAPVIPDLNPKPVLVAIIKADNKKVALVESGGPATVSPTNPAPGTRYPRPNPTNPANPNAVITLPTGPRRESAQQLEVGQEYRNGYKVTEIADTSVTFTYGNNQRSETILLYSRDRRGARPPGPIHPGPIAGGVPANQPPQVFNVGGSTTGAAVAGQNPGFRPNQPGMQPVQPGVQPMPSGGQPTRPGVQPVSPVSSINPPVVPMPGVNPAVSAPAPATTTIGGASTTSAKPAAPNPPTGERQTPWGTVKTRK